MKGDYDLLDPIDTFLQGVVLQREVYDAVKLAFAADGHLPLTAAQTIAAVQTAPPEGIISPRCNVPTLPVVFPVVLPPYPTGLPRFADSNPASDGWSIDNPDMCFQ